MSEIRVLTEEELVRKRTLHRQRNRGEDVGNLTLSADDDYGLYIKCGQPWPCEIVNLLATTTALRAEVEKWAEDSIKNHQRKQAWKEATYKWKAEVERQAAELVQLRGAGTSFIEAAKPLEHYALNEMARLARGPARQEFIREDDEKWATYVKTRDALLEVALSTPAATEAHEKWKAMERVVEEVQTYRIDMPRDVVYALQDYEAVLEKKP